MTEAPQAGEPERPRAVTVIGRIWLVVAVLLTMKALVNLITWSVLDSTSPALLRAAEQASPRDWFFGPLLRHAAILFVVQALAWSTVGLCAVFLLRMRGWARVAIQAVCWFNLAYLAGFLAFWVTLWTNAGHLAALDPSLTGSRRGPLLAAGVGACVLLGAALGVMVGFLRSSRVRAAFDRARSAGR